MRLSDYITEDLVFVIHGSDDKISFLHRLMSCVKNQFPDIDDKRVLALLAEREKLVPTVISHGVAIPHAIVEGLEKILCVIAQIPEGVDFQAMDTSPVQVAFLLLIPPERTGEHLKLLARIARLVSKGEFISRIVKAEDAGEVYALVGEEDRRHV